MNEQERKSFVLKEIEAIHEEFKNNLEQLVLLGQFLGDLMAVAKGGEPNYKASDIFKK